MTRAAKSSSTAAEALPFGSEHYREIKRRHIVRLSITYLAPLILLVFYFQYRYNDMVTRSRGLHLSAIAEHQANTLDLFLSERRTNLANLIDHPTFRIPPPSASMQDYMRDLKRISDAFIDIGFFDSSGVQTAYAGPYPSLEQRNYSSEEWYVNLKNKEDNFVITDVYLGFRLQPHFTIAVSRLVDAQFVVLRATLDPQRMYDFLTSQRGVGDVATSIINRAGAYQLVSKPIGSPLEICPFLPSSDNPYGTSTATVDNVNQTYAYHWLGMADWALIVQSTENSNNFFWGLQPRVLAVSALLVMIVVVVIFTRANKLVLQQKESDQTRSQLEHAAKLASVGELAAGIAHEINNPLAVISEESGLIMDYLNPQFGLQLDQQELLQRLQTIQSSAFRCRDITRKLLAFVRKSELDLQEYDIHEITDSVVKGLLGPEFEVSNIVIERHYDHGLPLLVTDKNHLQQVILNIVNNASDAIGDGPGTITITTSRRGKHALIAIKDTGHGMTPQQLENIFVPFFTTKEVGKGTGLGLSVSFGIIRSLGGVIEVSSTPRVGSTFTIVLPIRQAS